MLHLSLSQMYCQVKLKCIYSACVNVCTLDLDDSPELHLRTSLFLMVHNKHVVPLEVISFSCIMIQDAVRMSSTNAKYIFMLVFVDEREIKGSK